jgi:hypothetical protein
MNHLVMKIRMLLKNLFVRKTNNFIEPDVKFPDCIPLSVDVRNFNFEVGV